MESKSISAALGALQEGRFVLIYDGDEREGEADLIISARAISPQAIERLRKDAGGLICVAIPPEAAERLKLPFMADVLCQAHVIAGPLVCDRTAYGDKPSFSLAVNHRKVYTGITDNDRSLTISNIERMVSEKEHGGEDFSRQFYTPGHVFLLIGRGIDKRKGHTELSLELGQRAGLGAMVLCEMLGSGKALSKKEAKAYAERNGLVFLEGKEIIKSAKRS